jgi:hypothetical protein
MSWLTRIGEPIGGYFPIGQKAVPAVGRVSPRPLGGVSVAVLFHDRYLNPTDEGLPSRKTLPLSRPPA